MTALSMAMESEGGKREEESGWRREAGGGDVGLGTAHSSDHDGKIHVDPLLISFLFVFPDCVHDVTLCGCCCADNVFHCCIAVVLTVN